MHYYKIHLVRIKESLNIIIDASLVYFDRICWRLPDHIQSEGGLGLHLDLNP